MHNCFMMENFYQKAFNSIDTPIYVTDTEGTIIYVNSAFERLTGYEKREAEGRKTSILKSGEMPESYYTRLWEALKAGKNWKEEIVNRRKDSSLYTVLQSISPAFNEKGDIQYYTAVQYDITREKELQDERNIFFSVSIDLFCIIDRSGCFRQLNRAWQDIILQPIHSLIGTKALELVFQDDKTALYKALRELSGTDEVISVDSRIKTGGTSFRWISWKIFYHREKKLLYVSGRDIQERVEMEQEIRRISVTDALTGIYNRLQIDKIMRRETQRAKRNKKPLSIILLDIDYFKTINDTYGHQRGDNVLIELVRVVSSQIREYDFFARWGGEEFIIISPETDNKDAAMLAERIRTKVEQHLFEESGNVTVSIGISLYDFNDDEEISFLKRADEALYEAKKQGRNKVVIF